MQQSTMWTIYDVKMMLHSTDIQLFSKFVECMTQCLHGLLVTFKNCALHTEKFTTAMQATLVNNNCKFHKKY